MSRRAGGRAAGAAGWGWGPLVVAALAAAAHLVVGFLYLVAGLAVPAYALLPLWLIWLVLAAVLVRLAVQRSWWTPAVPVGAMALYLVVVAAGDQMLGWTA